MQLKISRASGNYLVLQLPGAVLTAFKDACGDNPQIDLQLPDGAEGDAQFRVFLAQVVDAEGGPVPSVETMRSLQRRVIDLQEENEHLAEQVRQQGIALNQAAPSAVDELKPRLHEAKIGEGVGPWPEAVGPGNIFQGKSLYWLQGFQANREWRQDCEHSNASGEAYPARPENPYGVVPHGEGKLEHSKMRSWGSGWSECNEYPLDSIPDPTTHIINLEKAK